jgi:hypothetical protein
MLKLGMAHPNRDAMVEVAGKISALKAEFQRIKLELKAAETEFDRLLSGDSPSKTNLFGEPVSEPRQGSITQRILELLESDLEKSFDSDEIIRALPGANEDSVRSALARMAGDSLIVRPMRGRYQSRMANIQGAA